MLTNMFMIFIQEGKIQKGGNDCGIFLCWIADTLALRLSLYEVKQSLITKMRNRMKEEIVRGLLTPLTFGRDGKVKCCYCLFPVGVSNFLLSIPSII